MSLKTLNQFKENFLKRYESREMPLLFVLDNEVGIGYAKNTQGDVSPLIDDFIVPLANSQSSDFQNSIHSILFQKYRQSSQHIIELTDKDVQDIDVKWDDLPPTLSVICEILKDNKEGCAFFIKGVSGMSAAALLGRFCHLNEQILNNTIAITEKEAKMYPDKIFAEIVHLPESRLGNILLRPILRPYEIPYLANTSVSAEFEISPNDLYVSIKNNRIILRSKKLNKEIIPRMSTAHNYSGQNPMPVYHFLCDMQHQDGRVGLWFNWPDIVQNLDYLPRVVYRNCILSKARWTIHKKDIKIFTNIIDEIELLQKIREWRIERNIPERVTLSDDDNELYVDMNNPLSIRAWLSIIKSRSHSYLEEFLFDPSTAIVYGPEGVFTNEFIVPFYKES